MQNNNSSSSGGGSSSSSISSSRGGREVGQLRGRGSRHVASSDIFSNLIVNVTEKIGYS